MQLRDMRTQRGWSQEYLAELSGLSVRTIQRIENGQTPGLASATSLAGAFGLDVDQLLTLPSSAESSQPELRPLSFAEATKTCLTKYADFDGRAGRDEYWWFFLFVVLAAALGEVVHQVLGAVVTLLLLLPLAAAGTRRLHATGHSGWWQLFAVAPFGFVVPLVLLVRPSTDNSPSV